MEHVAAVLVRTVHDIVFCKRLGLNVSSAFNSGCYGICNDPVTADPANDPERLAFPFDKLNEVISTKGKVPIIADLMASRWAYEALVVDQFMNNSYEKPYYNMSSRKSGGFQIILPGERAG
jgi:hypothetical protein